MNEEEERGKCMLDCDKITVAGGTEVKEERKAEEGRKERGK